MYIIRDRGSGNEIEYFATLDEAVNELREYEIADLADGIYEEDFYEIIEWEN